MFIQIWSLRKAAAMRRLLESSTVVGRLEKFQSCGTILEDLSELIIAGKLSKMEPKTPTSGNSESGSVFFDQTTCTPDLAPTKANKRNISKSKLREYRDAFSLFDKDDNGYLTKEELGHVMHQLGQWARMEELQEMLSEVDTDGDGNVSFEEFVEILNNITDSDQDSSAAQEEQELRDAFRVFDKHNRGYITASDLRAVLQCLGEDLDEDESKYLIDELRQT